MLHVHLFYGSSFTLVFFRLNLSSIHLNIIFKKIKNVKVTIRSTRDEKTIVVTNSLIKSLWIIASDFYRSVIIQYHP